VLSAPAAAIDPFHELGTKYIFGFTEGSDIEAEGEKAIEFETTAAFGMRGGSFSAIEQEIEFENTPTQFLQYELSAHGLLQSVNNVDGLDNFHNFNFSGLSAEFRFLLLGLGPDSPIGLTFVVEPEWARVDGVSGALKAVDVGGKPYRQAFVCKPQDCGDRKFEVMFDADATHAYGALGGRSDPPAFYGAPPPDVQDALAKGFQG